MNHAANPTIVANVSADAGSFLRTAATLAVVSVILAPIAIWQFGAAGAGLVAVFAVVIAATGWVAHWVEVRIVSAGHTVAGLLAASGVRMAVPLITVLLFVILAGRFMPIASVLLMVPLYLSVLCVDTLDHVRRQTNRAGANSSWPTVGQARRGQG